MVAAPLPLAALERGAAADGDEHVLERGAAAVVRVDVARRDRPDAERGGEVAQVRVAARVAALVRALQLDVEAVAAEGAREPRRRVRVADGEPVARAAGEADEPLVQLLEQRLVEPRRQRLAVRRVAGVRVRRRQQPAEVRVAARALHEERHVRLVRERDLRPGDRPHAEVLRRVRELERAVDAVVVGERERLVAELGRAGRELLRLRRAVEERVRRVRVQLDVRHDPRRWTSRTSSARRRRASRAVRAPCPRRAAAHRGARALLPADFEGVDPHTHPDHTDSFYVLEGEVEFLQDGEWHRAGPGTFLSVPPNVEHGFRPCGERRSACSTSTRRTSASSSGCGTSAIPGV